MGRPVHVPVATRLRGAPKFSPYPTVDADSSGRLRINTLAFVLFAAPLPQRSRPSGSRSWFDSGLVPMLRF